MKILIVDNGSSYLNALKQLVSDHELTTRKYDEIIPRGNLDYDLIILSGGHQFPVIGHEDIFKKEIDLIKIANIPVLGICLGFELIAHSYGATLLQQVEKEKSILKINQVSQDSIFDNLRDISVFESHRWVVTKTGADLIPLADSKDGIEIIRHKDKLIYGFQFHPEMFVDQTQGDELFANFIKIVQNRSI